MCAHNECDKNRLHMFERQILKKIFGPLQTGEDTWRIQKRYLAHYKLGKIPGEYKVC
jgi:hypothetical protein